MNKPRVVYVYSTTNDYMTEEYIDIFKDSNAELRQGSLETFYTFVTGNPIQQLDTETNVTEKHTERNLYVVQLGNVEGTEQHIFDINDIDEVTSDSLRTLLASDVTFIAQNAKFEYMILHNTLK